MSQLGACAMEWILLNEAHREAIAAVPLSTDRRQHMKELQDLWNAYHAKKRQLFAMARSIRGMRNAVSQIIGCQ